MGESQWSGTGTSADPWVLKTAPLSSEYRMYRDDSSSPPLLVCQVGSTKLTYLARAIDDLHAELLQRGDWVVLGAADESKDAAADTVEAWGRWEGNPVGGWYGAAQRVPRSLRYVSAAPPRGAGTGRTGAQPSEQPGASSRGMSPFESFRRPG